MTTTNSAEPLMDFAPALLVLIHSPGTRDDVVPKYATAILFESFARPPVAKTQWSVVNRAIMTRWSLTGLTYIKRKAWKSAERMAREWAADGRHHV